MAPASLAALRPPSWRPIACGPCVRVASSARIGGEAGRPGWHAARAAAAACLRWKAERDRFRHFLTVSGAGLPMPRSRRMQTSAAGLRSEVCIRVSEGQGCPKRTSGDGAWAIPTPPVDVASALKRGAGPSGTGYTRIWAACSMIVSSGTRLPLLQPGQASAASSQAFGERRFESQKGQVRHWRGRSS